MSVLSVESLLDLDLDLDLEPLPRLRLLPVPACEPPYDDELPVPPPPPVRLAPLRVLLARQRQLVSADGPDLAPDGATSALPDARPVAHAVIQGLLEVQAGVRPLLQLRSTTTPELYEQLEDVVRVGRRRPGSRPRTRAVRSLHVQQRDDGVAEICARVQCGPRATAIALRLEATGGRWLATALAGL